MKAVVCDYVDGSRMIQIRDVEAPTLSAREVMIEVKASGVNARDLLSAKGLYQGTPVPPFILGCEVAGVVVDIGSEVTEWKCGDRVMAFSGWGGFAEKVAVNALAITTIPPGMSFSDAAAFLVTYGTAEYSLKRVGLRPGERLLVTGAAGATGRAAIEIGRALGAAVIATVREARDAVTCLSAGAMAVISHDDEIRTALKEHGGHVDVVFDVVSGAVVDTLLKSLQWGGRYIVVGFASGDIAKIPSNIVLLKGIAVVGVWWGEFVRRDPSGFRRSNMMLASLFERGMVHPSSIERSIESAPDVLRLIDARHLKGKIVLIL